MSQPSIVARRIGAALIDGAIFIAIWQAVMAVSGVRFPFGIMQQFSKADYDAYVRVMTWMTIGLFLLSLAMHRLFGASLGKLCMRLCVRGLGGGSMSWRQILLRSATMFLLGLMILAPGPLIAFVFGRGSEASSLLALTLGFACLMLTTIGNRQSLLEHWLGIETVRLK